jgi:UDP-N-acetylglucosamine acyltransferase
VASIHATAIVDRHSEVAADVVVGPYAIVEAGAAIGPGCVLHAHAVVRGRTVLGPRNVLHPFSVVGGEPQAKQRDEGPSPLQVGEGNAFREHTTVHGSIHGRSGGCTRIGSHNLFMVGSHVAHDVVVGSHCVFANAVQLAGHAVIEDWVTFGGLSGVTQHVRVGESAFVAAASACERNVPPYVVVQGNRARVRGLNVVGLRRRGVPEESIVALQRAVRKLWLSRLTRRAAMLALRSESEPHVCKLLSFLEEASP